MGNGNSSLGERLHALDRAQQRYRPLAFGVAVLKKFADDNAGQLAGLVAFYAFFSLFPLLLVLVTLLGILLHGDPRLQTQILHSTVAQFPIIGPTIQRNVQSLRGSGLVLVLGIGAALFAGLGVTRAAQTAFDRVWDVPARRRHSFLRARAQGLALLGVLGLANIGSTLLTGAVVAGAPNGPVATAGALVLSFAINFGLFMAAFSLLTSYPASFRELLPGALVATVVWELLQTLGGLLVAHQLAHAKEVGGYFGSVIGLLSWLYLGAQLTLLAAEINVVRARRLWPRSVL